MNEPQDYGPQPPHDEQAEICTLGGMLLNNEVIPEVLEAIRPDDYYRPANTLVHRAIVDLHTAGEPADAITVSQELEKRGELRRIGGAPALLTLIESVPTATNAGYYARSVARKAKMRRLIETGSKFQQVGYGEASSDDEVDQAVAQAEKWLREIQEPTQNVSSFSDIVTTWLKAQQSPDNVIATPWPELNNLFNGGARRGQLIVVGARPASGKTNFGLNVTAFAAESALSAAVFSLEVGKEQVANRLLAAGAWANYGQVVAKKLDSENYARIEEYIDSHRGMNLSVIDRPNMTVEQVVAGIRSMKTLDVAFIDYCQLLAATNPRDSREQQIAHMTRALKVAALECNVAIYLAAQVNRAPTTGQGRVPSVSDLRESGSLEANADIVVLLHRETPTDPVVQVIVGKNRDGKAGQVEMVFRGNNARIG